MSAIGAAPAALHPKPGRPTAHALRLARRGAIPTWAISRPHLVARLADAPAGAVALVVAPAGYGKSTLLAEWEQVDPRPFARVRLTTADDDPGRLAHAVAEALGVAGVRASRDRFVLVLDDAHRVVRRDTLTMLVELIDAVAPAGQVALAARQDLGLPVARLRAERRLVELRPADLVLTRSEVAATAAASGLTLSDSDADLLTRRTEGWPTGVALALLAARNDPQPSESLASFRGADRAVADYVRDEIMAPISRRATDFLTRCSILTRLSAPVCDYLLERSDSGRVLADLARTNLLVIPLDRTASEFRCHSLLADALRSELRRQDPDAEAALQMRASTWYEQNGDPALAMEHARAAGDLDRAAALVWREAPSLVAYGHRETVAVRLNRFAHGRIAERPSLALAAALVDAAFGNRSQAEHWAATALCAMETGGKLAVTLSAAAVRAIMASLAATRPDEMHEQAALAYAAAAEDSPLRALACLIDGVALDLSSARRDARARLAEGERRGAATAPVVQVLCLAQLALVAIDEDDWEAARTEIAHARAQVERVGLGDYPACALVFAVSAAVRGRFGQVESCQSDGREADRLLAALSAGPPWFGAECRIALARAALRMSDLPRAQALVAAAERDLKLLPAQTFQRALDACRRSADEVAATRDAGGEALTSAELRVLQFLPTQMSFREIADELVVSRNTVKTHARSVYRKLLASGRSDAVGRARAAGFLDAAP